MGIKLNKSYVLSPGDLIEARHLTKTKSRELYANYAFLFLFFSLLIVTVCRIKNPNFLIINSNFQPPDYYSNISYRVQDAFWVFVGFLLFWGITFPRYDIVTRWREYRDYKQNVVSQETKLISITQDSLTIQSDNFRESRKWTNLEQVLENQQIFLLFHSRGMEFTLVPKRIFDSEIELNTFRSLTGITKN